MDVDTGAREKANHDFLTMRDTPIESHSVYFSYALEQDVTLTSIKLPARIVGRGEKRDGHIYLVVWWAENKRYEAWLYEHELEG